MAYKDRDELLDDFFDHLFDGEEEVTDEDHEWFESKVTSFFDKLEGVKPPGRRRSRGQPSPIKRDGDGGGKSRRRSSKSSKDEGYNPLSLFFGSKEGA